VEEQDIGPPRVTFQPVGYTYGDVLSIPPEVYANGEQPSWQEPEQSLNDNIANLQRLEILYL
jgi:hypothetical protein